MAVATVDELATYLGRSFEGSEEEQAALILNGVQSEMESLLGRPIGVRTFTDEEHIVARDDMHVFFTYTPVVSIGSIALDDTQLVADDDYTLRSWGVDHLRLVPVSDLSTPPRVVVTYDAGLDVALEKYAMLKHFLLRAAARELNRLRDDMHGVKKANVEGSAFEYSEYFTEQEIGRMQRFKRRKIR